MGAAQEMQLLGFLEGERGVQGSGAGAKALPHLPNSKTLVFFSIS